MTLYVVAAIILAVGGFIAWLFLAGKSAGKDAIAADVAENAAEISQKQAEAQANAPRSKDAVVDRLRDGVGL